MAEIFIVTCHGWSGSSWLANTLHSHPDIHCTHVLYNRLPSTDDSDSKFASDRYFDIIRQEAISRQETPIDCMLDKLILNIDKPYIGNVGLYRLRDLPVLSRKFGSCGHSIKVVNLIRNPLSVVFSGYGQFMKRFQYDLHELYWNLGKLLEFSYEHLCEIRLKYGVDLGDAKNISFFAAAQTLASLRLDIEAYEMVKDLENISFLGTITMEEITSSARGLQDLTLSLIPSLSYQTSFFENAILQKAINTHYCQAPRDAAGRFKALEHWQQESVLYFWRQNRVEEFYKDQGYNFDFLDQSS